MSSRQSGSIRHLGRQVQLAIQEVRQNLSYKQPGSNCHLIWEARFKLSSMQPGFTSHLDSQFYLSSRQSGSTYHLGGQIYNVIYEVVLK